MSYSSTSVVVVVVVEFYLYTKSKYTQTAQIYQKNWQKERNCSQNIKQKMNVKEVNRSDYSIVLNGLSSLDTVDTDTVAIAVTVAVAVWKRTQHYQVAY